MSWESELGQISAYVIIIGISILFISNRKQWVGFKKGWIAELLRKTNSKSTS